MFAGIVGGVLRCFRMPDDISVDMVYGDYVINGTLAAGYDVSIGGNEGTAPIYNIVSSNDYEITFGKSILHSKSICAKHNFCVRSIGKRNSTVTLHCCLLQSTVVSNVHCLP